MKNMKHHGHGKIYLAVWVLLLVLTVLTVSVSYYNFGTWNIFVAMLVATIKGALVCLYFMHLKYDNRVNQVVFVSAFFFLAVFVGLTASDELFRRPERAVNVAPVEEKTGGAEMQKFLTVTPELLAKGKEIYAVQCAVCHGATGKGDGAGSAALNPKPRDFTSGYWKFGGGPAGVFKTITEGSPGTGMAGFSNLSVQERFALAHYVRSFSPSPAPEDKPEDLAPLGIGSPDSVGSLPLTATAEPKYKIPLSFAMKRIADEEVRLSDVAVVPAGREAENLGGKLYQAHCLTCHGLNGKGGIAVKRISVNPAVYLKTKAFSDVSRTEFIDLVSKGLPGSGKPGIASFTNEEWDMLHQYVQSLRP